MERLRQLDFFAFTQRSVHLALIQERPSPRREHGLTHGFRQATTAAVPNLPNHARLTRGRRCRLRLCHPHSKQPSEPQEEKVKGQENNQAWLAAKRALGDKPENVRAEVANNHKDDVVDDEFHDLFSLA